MDRFIIQRSATPGWWVATDKENNIVVQFEHGKYNDTQKVTLLNGDTFKDEKEALKVATYLRELADWLRENHYEKLFPMSLRDIVGTQIRRERKRQGLSGKQLAERAGFSEPTINKIENGRWNVSIDILENICAALGKTLLLE
jgi:DNA-binding XRE family transcriptional regulator